LEDVYTSIPSIIPSTVKLQTSYLGVAGTLVPSGGTAITTDVCSTKTFFGASQSDWNTKTGALTIDASKMLSTATYCGVTGSITSSDSITGSNGTLAITIPDGYYSGSKTATASDTNLLSGNIKSGINIFGVDGNSNVVDTSSGSAASTDILTGKKAWVDGVELTGNIASNNSITGSNGTLAITIPDGYYSGSKTATASDTNLIAANIKKSTSIFGVTGLYVTPPPATDQTDIYGTSRTCSDGGTGTCEDGYYKSGSALSYSDVTINSIKVAVIDANTGLMWNKCTAGLSGSTCTTGAVTSLAWKTAGGVTEAIDYCENIKLCNDGTYQGDKTTEGDCTGHDGNLYIDWRLPNLRELFTLVVLTTGQGAPYINKTYFPATGNAYWSSTTHPAGPAGAFDVYFNSPSISDNGKTSGYNVRCVR
jgi:hypothetical protein